MVAPKIYTAQEGRSIQTAAFWIGCVAGVMLSIILALFLWLTVGLIGSIGCATRPATRLTAEQVVDAAIGDYVAKQNARVANGEDVVAMLSYLTAQLRAEPPPTWELWYAVISGYTQDAQNLAISENYPVRAEPGEASIVRNYGSDFIAYARGLRLPPARAPPEWQRLSEALIGRILDHDYQAD